MSVDKSFLVTANSSQEDYNANCDYCLVDFSPEFLEKLAVWKKAFQEVKVKLSDVALWQIGCTDAAFISRKDAEGVMAAEAFERLDENIAVQPVAILNRDDFDLEKFDATVADEIFMGPQGFWFEAAPQYGDGIVVSSGYFPWTWFTQCSNCGKPRDEHVNGKCLFEATTYASTAPRLDG